MGSRRATGRAKPKRASARERISAYRRRMRAMGYRPVEVWVPDVRNSRFIAAFRRQCRRVAAKERTDPALEAWLDASAGELSAEIDRTEDASGAPHPSWGPESPI
jgi:hypothetical protein